MGGRSSHEAVSGICRDPVPHGGDTPPGGRPYLVWFLHGHDRAAPGSRGGTVSGAPPPIHGQRFWDRCAVALWQRGTSPAGLGGAMTDFSPRSVWRARVHRISLVHAHGQQWALI